MEQNYEFISKQQNVFLTVGEHDSDEVKGKIFADVENLKIELDALNLIHSFPNIKRLILCPGMLRPDDLKYLEGLEIEELKLEYESDCVDAYSIDLSMFPKLKYVFARSQFDFCNTKGCPQLITLKVARWESDDLQSLVGSQICALYIGSGKLKSLSGMESLSNLRSFSVSYQRQLSSFSALKYAALLESLEIENCCRLNFSDLPILPNLEFLALLGGKEVASLSFLGNFPKLKYCYLDFPIRDGDLTPLSGIKHGAVLRDRRNFSLKNAELPKTAEPFASKSIPHQWEILPWN